MAHRTGAVTVPLEADVVVRRGSFTLEARVEVADGETLALLGPNGSGKSTLLSTIAGLLSPERGTIAVNGRVMTGVTPDKRRVGLLGQDPLLFPHLSARENVAFGWRARGGNVREARALADSWLEAVGLAELADRKPAHLSGGQQQRVAIARALAAQPDVLLLDEPMAALDVRSAAAVRTLLRDSLRQSGLPTVVVSHDVIDAMVLADRVAILDAGRIVDEGDTASVLAKPKSQFAAALVGLNLVHGTVRGDGSVRDERGRLWQGGPGQRAVGQRVAEQGGPGQGVASHAATLQNQAGRVESSGSECDPLEPGDAVTVTFPPTAVRIGPAAVCPPECPSPAQSQRPPNSQPTPHSQPTPQSRTRPDEPAQRPHRTEEIQSADDSAGSWRATVGSLEPAVHGIRVPFAGDEIVAELTPAEILEADIREGMTVSVRVDPSFVTVHTAHDASRVMKE